MKKIHSIITTLFCVILMVSCGTKTEQSEEKKNIPAAVDKPASANNKKTILFFGNSLTAGYGVEPEQAFPALIQKKIDSLHIPFTVVNGGVSGETSSGGNSRVDWALRQPVDVFVLELGGNDGLRGIAVEETRKNLQAIIDKVIAKNPQTKLILAGMQMPPSMGQDYITQFRGLYPELAAKNNMAFIPFLLENVGGETDLNQSDGIHPNEKGHIIVAENVWKILQPLL